MKIRISLFLTFLLWFRFLGIVKARIDLEHSSPLQHIKMMHIQFGGGEGWFSLALLILAAKEGKICLSTTASSLKKQSFISLSPRSLSRKRPLFWSPTLSIVSSRSIILTSLSELDPSRKAPPCDWSTDVL